MPFLSPMTVLQTVCKYDTHIKNFPECNCEHCNNINALSNYLSTHNGTLPESMYKYYNYHSLRDMAQKYLVENDKNYM